MQKISGRHLIIFTRKKSEQSGYRLVFLACIQAASIILR